MVGYVIGGILAAALLVMAVHLLRQRKRLSRLAEQMEDFLEVLGDRPCALVREISKMYQEARRGTLASVLASLDDGVKGELVLVVAPAQSDEALDDDAWHAEALEKRAQGEPVKKIAEELAAKYAVPKNRVKSWLLAEKNG